MMFLLKLLFTAVNVPIIVALLPPTKCGLIFYNKSGKLSYDSSISGLKNKSCEWRIAADPDETVTITFDHINISKSPNCSVAYIAIKDGYWSSSPDLNKFCGKSHQPLSVSSTTNKMLVSYTNPGQNGDFEAKYQAVCGGDIFVDKEAQLTTPSYPDLYPPNKKCIWRITVREDKKAALRFDSFNLEKHDQCLYDYVEVKDGFTDDSNLIGVYCNDSTPSEIISSNNNLFVKFVSDSTVHGAGFSATIIGEDDECTSSNHKCAQICVNTVGSYTCDCESGFQLHSNGRDCEVAYGGTLTTLSGTITSPLWPEKYPPNSNCTWDIIVPPQYLIKIVFDHVDLEGIKTGTQLCAYDSLKIFSNVNNLLTRQSYYCGDYHNLPPALISKSNVMKVVFNSDGSNERSGFVLHFESVFNGCTINNGNCRHGCTNTTELLKCTCNEDFFLEKNNRDCTNNSTYTYEIATTSGTIKSLNYPNYYLNNMTFTWQFTTTPGHRLNISVLDIETEGCFDRLEFYDGTSVNGPSFATICSSIVTSRPVYSSGNELYMLFVSDYAQPRKGFFLTYSSVCGGVLQADKEQKYVYSHANFGYSDYDSNSYCEWIITAETEFRVNVSFLDFDLEKSKKCSNDYVEILNGNSSCAPSFGKFCGSELPPKIRSTANSLLVRFRTNEDTSGRGFSLMYQLTNTVTGSVGPE